MAGKYFVLMITAGMLAACSPPAPRLMSRAAVCDLAEQRRAEWRNLQGASLFAHSASYRRAHQREIAELEGHCTARPAPRKTP